MDDALVLMPATVHALQWIASQPCDFVYEESEPAELETTETEWRWKKENEEEEKKLDSYIFLGFLFHNDRHRHVDGISRRASSLCIVVQTLFHTVYIFKKCSLTLAVVLFTFLSFSFHHFSLVSLTPAWNKSRWMWTYVLHEEGDDDGTSE